MAVFCAACGVEILPGQDSTSMSSGVVKKSKKSGRVFHEGHHSDSIHANIDCHLLYLAQRDLAEAGLLMESLTDRVRERIEPDLRIELTDEIRESEKDELREEVIDELGRYCVVCGEEMEHIRAEVNEDDYSPTTQPAAGWFQQPVPLKIG